MPRPRRSRYQANEANDYGYSPDAAYDYVSQQYNTLGYGYGSNQTYYPNQSYGYGSSQPYYSHSYYPSQDYYPTSNAYNEPVFDAYGDYSGDYSSNYDASEGYTEAHNTKSSPPSASRQQRSYTTLRQSSSQSPKPSSPPPPPPPRSPSPTYLHTSLSPSTQLSDPSTSRKLLILDLNGTLLLRSGRPARRRIDNQPPPPRTVHPRPYLPAFVEYLLHPETVKWLDTMVWSSAQPHSVKDMVDKCFGKRQGELVAIWARDKMGLSSVDYHRKTQTTKDLNKPWAHLTRSPSSPFRSLPPSSLPPSSSPSPEIPSPPNQGPSHSAMTTLLLDDSPLKATLQPYNHVCIHEYDSSLRANDLQILERRFKAERERKAREILEDEVKKMGEREKKREEERRRKEAAAAKKAEGMGDLQNGTTESRKKRKRKAKQTEAEPLVEHPELDGELNPTDPQSPHPGPDDGRIEDYGDGEPENAVNGGADLNKKRKRQEQLEETPLDPSSLEDPDPSEPQSPCLQTDDEQKFDQTLLTVIGVLDTLKLQSNVAGWIRSGKLVASFSPAVQDKSYSDVDFRVEDGHKMKKQKMGDGSIVEETGADEGGDAPMWFTHAPTMEYWSEKGKEALAGLGISVKDGIER